MESKMGRPRIQVDFEQVRKLCEIMATAREISHVLGVSEDTLSRRCLEEFSMTFAELIKKNQAGAKISLRRAQMHKAMSGSVPMLIWLGKQYLGQRDKVSEDQARDFVINMAYQPKSLRSETVQ